MTVTETLAMSYLNSTSVIAGSATEQASAREEKYTALALSHTFIPIATATISLIGFKASFFTRAWSSPFSHIILATRESLHSYFSD